MRILAKALLAFSLLLLILSYPVCQHGERKVQSEMAKYPADFVARHQFDLIFVQWALPGLIMFSIGGLLLIFGIVVFVVEKYLRTRQMQ